MDIISIINMKGGVGKTTLAVNICDCLVRRNGKKVLLIDVDPQFNTTQCLIKSNKYINYIKAGKDTIINVFDRNNRTIASTINGISKNAPKELKDIRPYKVKDKYYLLPGSLDLYRLEMTPGEGRENRLKKYLSQINNKKYDFIIIDTPPTPSIWMTSALLASDYYLIPVKADPISVTGIDLLNSVIEDRKDNLSLNDIKCIGVVLTMTEENTLIYEQASKFLEKGPWKAFKYKMTLPKRTIIARKQMDGKFILELNDTKSKLALTGIVEELLRRLTNEHK